MSDLSYLKASNPDRFESRGDRPTMKAVVTTGNGGYDKLDYRDVPIPVPGPGEVLLRVLAAGVNNTEINTRLGWYSSSVEGGTEQLSDAAGDSEVEDGGWNETTPFPLIQGTDCCGEVVAAGDGVAQPEIGRRVLVRACMRLNGFDSLDNLWMASDFDGAFAQYVKVPANEVFEVDCDWTDVELATIPCAYGTAENMLHRAGVNAGDRVLVTGASGGVGSAVVQLAKRRGARVIAVAGANKVEQVRGLGADQVVPRDSDLIKALGESSVDVVIDNVAGEQFGPLLKLMARGGRYASSGAIAGPITTLDMRDFYLKDLTLIGCTAWDEPVFSNLIGYIENGEIRPLVAKVFDLKDIAAAQEEFLKKTHVGNFVLVPPQ
ncbi:alcohol dehydrogenase family protein [Marinobacter arenosus]|uniref:alcohol dehydrogenase family protein n=1 Tax=Marinobacter arenosus TaxID=2856822 RepID=UPI001E46DC28|nr:alcohol dehydrogenase family protein [Marinobacter arenosus]